MAVVRDIFKVLLAMFFVGGGINHFVNPDFYLPMMPPYVPMPSLMIELSGYAEIGLGILLLVPQVSRLAAWGLIALLIAVFPANLHMALHTEQFPDISPVALWLRLPMQGLLVWWAWVYTRKPVEVPSR